MRIVAVVDKYLPGHGGAQVMLHALLARAHAAGHDVRVAVRRKSPFAPETYEIDGIAVAQAVNDLRVELTAVDAVVTQDGAALAAASAAARFDAHLVQIVHDTHCRVGACLGKARPDLVVFNTHWVADHHAYHGLRSIVVHPPVDALQTSGVPPGDAVTLVNLRTSKGVDLFYDLAERLPDVPFLGVFGGYGQQVVRRDLANVELMPFARDVSAVWARTRVLLTPSWYEGYGLRCVEAMGYGIPVVSHLTVGLREAVGGAAIFADRDVIADWVRALRSLDDPLAHAAWSKRSRAHFEDRVAESREQLALWDASLHAIERDRASGARPRRWRSGGSLDELVHVFQAGYETSRL